VRLYGGCIFYSYGIEQGQIFDRCGCLTSEYLVFSVIGLQGFFHGKVRGATITNVGIGQRGHVLYLFCFCCGGTSELFFFF
jgi:hypothetical protein